MIRVNDSRLAKYGVKGLSIALPDFFHQPRNLNPKDKLPTYVAKIDDVDCLVIASRVLPENNFKFESSIATPEN